MTDTPNIPTPASFASIGIETFPTGEDVYNSVKISLADICAKATTQYAHKNYDEAADLFARASELQAELNGEMDPENAEILFLYGRSLFKVGQGKSDVLGGRAGGEKKKPTKQVKSKKVAEGKSGVEAQSEGGEIKPVEVEKKEEAVDKKKPLFQFTGDENFEDSDEDSDVVGAEGEGGDEEEEEDDLAVAFEVLDLARVLFSKKLEQPEAPSTETTSDPASTDKGKEVGDSPVTSHVKERLADTHDLLAEISLENERFPGAVTDFKAALQYKQELYPEESEIVAEAHFKLSLALEFASISKPKEDGEEETAEGSEGDSYLDQNLRDEAVKELEAAINSTKLKLQNKEVELASMHSPDDNDITREQITEVKEILADMENRLAELKGPAINVKEALYGPEAIGGVLGAALGGSKAETSARIEEAKKGATDLTNLVRKKKTEETATNGNGKRKAEDDVAGENGDSKKAKVEDAGED